MFSRETSLSVRVPVDLQPSGRLHNIWVYLYSVSSSTGASAISRLLTEAEIHSRHQCILSAVRRHQIVCAFLSHLLKPVFDIVIVPPGDDMWTTAVVLGTVGTIHFMANAIPACACGDEWQIRNRDLKCMGASGAPMCDLCWPRAADSIWGLECVCSSN